MIDLLTKKLNTFTENWQVPELEACLQLLTIIETERDMDKAIKKVKSIY